MSICMVIFASIFHYLLINRSPHFIRKFKIGDNTFLDNQNLGQTQGKVRDDTKFYPLN